MSLLMMKANKKANTKEHEVIWEAEINVKTEAECCRRYKYVYDSNR
jgi:hypothetical protein